MRRAFTLIELMVVVGIMSFLGVAATGGYSALQRGMAERGAVGAASSLLKAAKERALVDRSPTAVFCYNRLLREATETENAVVVGEMVAVRRAGRVTWVGGNDIVDEFMDVNGCYDIVQKAKIDQRATRRLWRFDDTTMTKMQYSLVSDAVFPLYNSLQLQNYSEWTGASTDAYNNYGEWARQIRSQQTLNNVVYAFRKKSGSTHEPSAWKVGNGYGFEFAELQLPKNFVFGRSIPVKLGAISEIKTFYFNPKNASDDSVEVMFCMPNASGRPETHHRAGQASSKDNQTI